MILLMMLTIVVVLMTSRLTPEIVQLFLLLGLIFGPIIVKGGRDE